MLVSNPVPKFPKSLPQTARSELDFERKKKYLFSPLFFLSTSVSSSFFLSFFVFFGCVLVLSSVMFVVLRICVDLVLERFWVLILLMLLAVMFVGRVCDVTILLVLLMNGFCY
jgi:hypothetical protein